MGDERRRARRASIGPCAVALALVLAAAPAFAQPTAAARETARALMDEGDKQRDAGEMKSALKSYEAADTIMKVPTTGIEVARAQVALGLLLESRETLARVTRYPTKPNEPAPFAAARKAAEALLEELGARIPSIQIIVTGKSDAQVQIAVDGEPLMMSTPRKVNPGKHVIVVRSGSLEKRQEVSVVERESKTVTIELKDPSAPPEAPVKVEETPSAPSSLPKIMMIGGFGLAIVGAGVGAVTGIMSLTKTSDLKDSCPDNRCASSSQGEIDSATTLGNVSTIAFIAGGVGLGVGVVGLVLSGGSRRDPSAARRDAIQARPVIGGSYVGLAGSF